MSSAGIGTTGPSLLSHGASLWLRDGYVLGARTIAFPIIFGGVVMTDQSIETVFDPHVGLAISFLMFALLISCGLAVKMAIDWAEKK